MLPPQHAVLPGCCLCAFASGCTGVSQIPCPRQHRLHLVPVTCTSYQPVLPTCSPLFGQANPIWKTVTVLLPSSPLESGAGTRNSYEFLCIRSTTCRKKNEKKKKKNETRDYFLCLYSPCQTETWRGLSGNEKGLALQYVEAASVG